MLRWTARTTLAAVVAAAVSLVPFVGAAATMRASSTRVAPPGASASLTSSASPPRTEGVFAYVTNSDYYASDGGTETLSSEFPGGTGKRTLLRPANVALGLLEFSPSGRRLAFFRAATSGARVDVMDVATRKVVSVFTLRSASAYVDGLAWTPRGRAVIVGSNQRPGSSKVHTETALWRIPAGGGRPTRLTPFEDAGDPTVTPDGNIVFVISKTFSTASTSLKKSAIWMVGPNGKGAELIFATRRFLDTPAVAPNGRTLAFTVVVNQSTTHLESVTLRSRRRRDLTPQVKGRTDISPSWSPDGSHILFLSSRAGRHATKKSEQLLDGYVMTATGRNPTEAIGRRGDKASVVFVSWGR